MVDSALKRSETQIRGKIDQSKKGYILALVEQSFDKKKVLIQINLDHFVIHRGKMTFFSVVGVSGCICEQQPE